MRTIILIGMLILVNACASLSDDDKVLMHNAKGRCYNGDAEMCRALGVTVIDRLKDGNLGLAYIDRGCTLGSMEACDQAKYFRAQQAEYLSQQQVAAQLLTGMAPRMIQPATETTTQPVNCNSFPTTNWDGTIMYRTQCQ